MAVFVLDKKGKPLMPCSEKRARQLQERGRGPGPQVDPVCHPTGGSFGGEQHYPAGAPQGLAIVRESSSPEGDCDLHVLALGEIIHRGALIGKKLTARRNLRRSRRSRKTPYRAARFANWRRHAGWLAPSLRHRVVTHRSLGPALRRTGADHCAEP
jgi:hypothetical protein